MSVRPDDEAGTEAGRPAAREDAPPVEPAAADGDAVEELDPMEALAAERDQYLDDLRRLKAEFDNYRRRSERDRIASQRAGVRDLVTDLLPVMDNLERALLAMDGHDESVVAGVEMVRAHLAGLLGGRGVAEIEAHARPFDPSVHEAVGQIPSEEHPEGTVVVVVEKGYRVDDVVARPARVLVAAPPPAD